MKASQSAFSFCTILSVGVLSKTIRSSSKSTNLKSVPKSEKSMSDCRQISHMIVLRFNSNPFDHFFECILFVIESTYAVLESCQSILFRKLHNIPQSSTLFFCQSAVESNSSIGFHSKNAWRRLTCDRLSTKFSKHLSTWSIVGQIVSRSFRLGQVLFSEQWQ